jgi:hypothetical protein
MSHGTRLVPVARLVPIAPLPLLLLTTAIALWPGRCLGGPPPLPDSRLGYRTVPLLLLTRPDICADLGLDAKQKADAERALTTLYPQAAALKGKTGPEAEAARRAIDEAQEHWLKTHLSDIQQRRLAEIDLQWEGPSALISRPVVADHIGLLPEQRTRLQQAIAERDRRRSRGDDWREREQQLARQALTVLTAEQRERWKAMLGRHFVPQIAVSHPTAPR